MSRWPSKRQFHAITLSLMTLILGVVLPSILLFQAMRAVDGLQFQSSAAKEISEISAAMPAGTRGFTTANDYSVFTVALMESSNRQTMINKQRMKTAVIHIGFALTSVGMLFILFGVDQGGLELAGTVESKVGVNLKVASTGLAVFVLGALMAALGGLLPNQYTTVGIPGYGAMSFIPRDLGAIRVNPEIKSAAIDKPASAPK